MADDLIEDVARALKEAPAWHELTRAESLLMAQAAIDGVRAAGWMIVSGSDLVAYGQSQYMNGSINGTIHGDGRSLHIEGSPGEVIKELQRATEAAKTQIKRNNGHEG